MKKEISDKIAQAFFDHKPKKKKKNKKVILLVGVIVLLFILLILAVSSLRVRLLNRSRQFLPESVVFEKSDGPYVLHFDFAKKASKMVSLNIGTGDLDLSRYNLLRFKAKFRDGQYNKFDNCIKVCLINNRQEMSCVYVKKVGPSWKNINLKLTEFLKVDDWAHLKKITFTLEEWNLAIKTSELLIDEVEFCSDNKS
ncbi:MAG: hypothetical protein ABIC68_00585 [Candidatus Omnitrophota bacterium]